MSVTNRPDPLRYPTVPVTPTNSGGTSTNVAQPPAPSEPAPLQPQQEYWKCEACGVNNVRSCWNCGDERPAPRAEPSAGIAEEFEKKLEAYRRAYRDEVYAHFNQVDSGEFLRHTESTDETRAALLDHERRLRERVEELEARPCKWCNAYQNGETVSYAR